MNKNVLLFTMSRRGEWASGVSNRNRQIAQEIEKCPDVGKIVEVDFLPHTWKRAAKIYFQDFITKPAGRVIGQTIGTRLTEVQPGKLYHIVSFEPIVSEQQFLRSLQKLLKKIDFHTDILWSYLPTYVQCFEKMGASVKVFDAVDDWSAHPAYRSWRNRLQKNYNSIAEHADNIFTVSESLLPKFTTNPSVHWIPNGVDAAMFREYAQSHPHTKKERPTIVYVGIIQERVDLELLAHLAQQRPQYDFIIAGPVWKGIDVSRILSLPNAQLLGPVPYDKLPELLTPCHVGIVPHKADALMRSMNPMKIYDYLAAGLPVVATNVAGFEEFNRGVTLARDPDTFLAALDQFVSAPVPAETLRALVAHHTWDARFAQMWGMISREQ